MHNSDILPAEGRKRKFFGAVNSLVARMDGPCLNDCVWKYNFIIWKPLVEFRKEDCIKSGRCVLSEGYPKRYWFETKSFSQRTTRRLVCGSICTSSELSGFVYETGFGFDKHTC